MMDISCVTCGKKYRIDESKMKGERAKVKCKACNHIMVINKPKPQIEDDAPIQTDAPGSLFSSDTPDFGEKPDGLTAPSVARETEVPKSAVERTAVADAAGSGQEDTETAPLVAGQKVRFGLFWKILIIMLIVSVLPLAAFWAYSMWETNLRIRNDTEAIMAQTAKGLGDQVSNWINNNVSILKTAARLPEIISMDRQTQEPILKAIQKEYPFMYLVFTVGTDGMNTARSDDVPLKDYSDRQYYKDVIRGKSISWQTLIGKTSKKPALVLAVPIKSENRIVGVMAAAMTVDIISNDVVNWKKGETGQAFLLDEKGFVVAHPNPEFIQKRKNLNSHPLISEYRKKGWTSVTTRFTNTDGKPSLGHVQSNLYGWSLALYQETNEVFDVLKSTLNYAIILLGCTIVVVIIFSWLMARAITTPIRKLTDAAERMSLGELNVRIDIKSRDEIGLLAQAIGRMQTSLRLAMNRLRRRR